MPAEFDPEKRVAGQRMSAQNSDFKVAATPAFTATSDFTTASDRDVQMSYEYMDALFNGEILEADERIWMLLSLYNDGEASPEEAAEVEQMLQNDAAYASAHAFMQQAGGAIRTISEIEPPANLCDAILAKTSRRPTFAQRVAHTLAAMRSRFALPTFHPVGRMALAGGGLATVALAAGIVSARMGVHSPQNGMEASILRDTAGTNAPLQRLVSSSPATQTDSDRHQLIPTHPLLLPGASELIRSNPDDAYLTRGETPSRTARPAQPTAGKADSLQVPNRAVPHNTSLANGKTDGKSGIGAKQQIASLTPLQGSTRVDEDVQNINPMMDSGLQHHTTLAGLPEKDKNEGDDLDDSNLVTSNTSTDVSGDGTSAPTERERVPTLGHQIEGQLMLSKLPPTARHIMSPADVARQLGNTVPASFTANSSDSSQHKTAEVRLLSTKF